MSKCEYINLLNETNFNTDEMFDALELLEENCAECNNPVCNPEEIQDIEALVDVIEEIAEDEAEECSCDDGLNLCEDCAREYELNKESYLSGEKILELCPNCYELYKEYNDECEDEKTDVELELEKLALKEEIRRTENFDKELIIPDHVKNSEVFKRAEIEAYSIVNAMRVLVNNGLDYQNSMVAATNSVTAYNNEQLQRIQAIAQQQQTI